MLGWFNRKSKEKQERTAKLEEDRGKLNTALVSLEMKRHHVEELMQRMLEERRA